MAGFTRLTIVGATRRVDVVVASDQVLAALVPRLIEVVGAPVQDGPFDLVRPLGGAIDLGLDCAGNQLLDGEVLHLVAHTRAPAPVAVSDVTDLVAGVRASLPGQWQAKAARVVAAVVIGVAGVLTGWWWPWGPPVSWTRLVVLLVVALVLVGAGVIAGRTGHPWAGTGVLAGAAGVCLPLAITAARLVNRAHPVGVGISVALVGVCVVLGVGAGVGLRLKPAWVTGAVCGLVAATGLVLLASGVRPDHAWGVVAVVGVAGVGLVPAWATTISGLTGLDDYATGGAPVERAQVLASSRDAFQIVSWTVTGLAVVTGIAGAGAVWGGSRWGAGLGLLVAVIMGLRARHLPGIVEVVALWTGMVAVAVVVLAGWHTWWRLPVLVVAGVLAGIGAGVVIPVHVGVRLRRIGDLIAKLALAASVPVLLGLFGVYTWLLHAYT